MANTKRDNIVDSIFESEEITIVDDVAVKYQKLVPIKKFFGDLHDLLMELGFTDTWPLSNRAVKKGEFVDNKSNLNRTGDMFEKSYLSIKREIVNELEIIWEAKRKCPESEYGEIYFALTLTNRFMADQEVDDGKGGKIKVQGGEWEVKFGLTYENNIKEEYLDKVPIIKNHEKLQKIYIDRFYMDRIGADLTWCQEKAKTKIFELIYRYFT